MLQHGETWEEHVVLGTQAQGVPGLGHVAPDVVAVNLRVSGGRGEQSSQHRHGRGLSRPIVAQQGSDLPLQGIEGHVIDRNHLLPAGEHLPEAADLNTLWLRRLILKQGLVKEKRGPLSGRVFRRFFTPVRFLNESILIVNLKGVFSIDVVKKYTVKGK